jgi:hypothetical protein
MQLDAFLCNHAEAVNNLLYVAGGGVNVGFTQPSAGPPYPTNLGIAIMVTVPWEQTNQQHQVEIELLNEDGHAVQLPTGPDATSPLQLRLAFNVGRPATVAVGDDQIVSLAANLAVVPLPAIAKYIFVVRIDGHDERTLGYRLMPPPGSQITVSRTLPGSTA